MKKCYIHSCSTTTVESVKSYVTSRMEYNNLLRILFFSGKEKLSSVRISGQLIAVAFEKQNNKANGIVSVVLHVYKIISFSFRIIVFFFSSNFTIENKYFVFFC